MTEKTETLQLARLINQKYISMFGEDSANPQDLEAVSLELASRFSWNMPRAKSNLEILTRQCWMRLRENKINP